MIKNNDQASYLHRQSIRLKGYEYSLPGAYFVTIVSYGHKCIFGKIIRNKMHLSDLGILAQDCWLNIPDHFTETEIIPFAVMPNHIHGIITIIDVNCRGTMYRAPTTTEESFGQPVTGSLPTIIRTYKAAVSRRTKRELEMTEIWQRNYYEHIIRNEKEYSDIWNYIETNPRNWMDDQLNPLPAITLQQ